LILRLIAHSGVTVSTVRAQRNPPGPGSFIWMAAGVRLLGGGELRDARLSFYLPGFCLSRAYLWLLPTADFLNSGTALFYRLSFPYSLTATATLLTEGPRCSLPCWELLFGRKQCRSKSHFDSFRSGYFGRFRDRGGDNQPSILRSVAASGCCACTLPIKTANLGSRTLWLASMTLSLTVAVIPLLLLVAVWETYQSWDRHRHVV